MPEWVVTILKILNNGNFVARIVAENCSLLNRTPKYKILSLNAKLVSTLFK